jgi:hypothetical protein
MRSCGANTKPIDTFLSALQKNKPLSDALSVSDILIAARAFVENTFSFFDKPIHQIAASFVFGREGIIVDLFNRLLKKSKIGQLTLTPELAYYLQPHVDLDTDSHYLKALWMLEAVWRRCTKMARSHASCARSLASAL